MRFHKQSLEISWLWLERKRSEEWIFSYAVGCKKKALSNILASSSSWKITKPSYNWKSFTLIYLQGFYSWLRIFRDTSLSILVFVNKSCCLLKFFIELYFLSWLFIKISFLSLCWLFSVVHEHHMQYLLEVKLKQKWFWHLLLLGVFEFFNKYFFYYCEAYIYYQVLFIQTLDSSHCTWHLFGGQKSEVAGWKGDFGNWITKIFLKVSAQSLLLTCILHRSRLTWLNSPV